MNGRVTNECCPLNCNPYFLFWAAFSSHSVCGKQVIYNVRMCVCVFIQTRQVGEMAQQADSDEATLELKESPISLQQEVEFKTKKLKKVAVFLSYECPVLEGIFNKFTERLLIGY